MFLFCLVFAMFCARLFICALWSPAGKELTSWLSFVVSSVSLSLSHWYPGSGVVLDCIDSWSLHHYLLGVRERSGSVVECLTWDQGAQRVSLTGITALCSWARHINPSLVLVQPRKTLPYITEECWWDVKNQIKQTKKTFESKVTCSDGKANPIFLFSPW